MPLDTEKTQDVNAASAAPATAARLFGQVLHIGPALEGKGGIAALEAQYSRNMHPFHHLATNSPRGTLAGLFPLAGALLRMPLERLRGRRLLHVHCATGKSWMRKMLIVRWGRMLGFRILLHIHSNPTRLAANARTDIGPALRRADKVVVLANSYAAHFRERYGVATVEKVNNMMDADTERATAPHSIPTFLFLGLIIEAKGVYELVEAARILKQRGRRFRIVIGGVGEQERLMAEAARAGVAADIECRGWVAGPEKNRAFADSDVLVLPSHSEGMPICVLEAMSASMPSIATGVGALPDMISDGQSGFVVPVGDSAALAEAMDRYLANPALIAEHGAAARARLTEYRPEAVLGHLADIYGAILG